MATKDLILAIDNGTQSLKALIFDVAGKLLAKEAVAFVPYYSEQPAWAEQDPEIFWKALVKACQGVWQHPGVDKERVGPTFCRWSAANDVDPIEDQVVTLDARSFSQCHDNVNGFLFPFPEDHQRRVGRHILERLCYDVSDLFARQMPRNPVRTI